MVNYFLSLFLNNNVGALGFSLCSALCLLFSLCVCVAEKEGRKTTNRGRKGGGRREGGGEAEIGEGRYWQRRVNGEAVKERR